VERQLRKGHTRPAFNSGSSSSWKPNLKREGTVRPRSFVPSRTEPPKAKVDVTTDAKGKSETQPKGTPDVLGLSLSSQFQWLNSSINPLIYVISLHLK
jgi:hypothetical protein